MTWKCPVCGYENADDSLFCIKCGTKKPEQVLPQSVEQVPSSSPQQPVQQSTTMPPTQVEQQVQSPQPEQQVSQSQQQVTVSGKYYLLFINTPNPAFNKTKLPLDFDIFPSISIGRSPENVIVIPDPEVSRKHAIISLENGELYIEDLNSTNGTYIYDGKVFQPVKGKMKIQVNSIIKLGNNTVVRIVGE
ncbi:MAG: FHA domain-containing protein [Saccharolobus sp.]|jgi:pSer/pThr/pTyr-binding forkhead associated (FHA) protein|uniref:FHA domain-containing protein n=1 Tax=Saccharolobus sp. TaxID=2100761 RepID=UPI0028CFA7CF|nr:FHA domain-containing protein [Saccharolobus sp.]MDT7861279.1 FHA domain-containing protein [Saccharolobus sp.]